MTAALPFDWASMTKFKRTRVPDGYPTDAIRFWSPGDDILGAIACLLQSATHSIVLSMYGYDSPELDQIIREKLADEHVYVQMNLDKTQAAGKAEKALLGDWDAGAVGNSIAIGTEHGAIVHAKVCIVDGVYMVSGSTNWSTGGMTRQRNECLIQNAPVLCAEARSLLDRDHDLFLQQMGNSAR